MSEYNDDVTTTPGEAGGLISSFKLVCGRPPITENRRPRLIHCKEDNNYYFDRKVDGTYQVSVETFDTTNDAWLALRDSKVRFI